MIDHTVFSNPQSNLRPGTAAKAAGVRLSGPVTGGNAWLSGRRGNGIMLILTVAAEIRRKYADATLQGPGKNRRP